MDCKTSIWMPLYIGDYLADTSHLNAEQSGAYLHLLMHYWRTGPLANNQAALRQISRCSEHAWSTAWDLLSSFFTLESDGRLHQKRMDAELDGWKAKRKKAKDKASHAANSRYAKPAPSSAPSSASSNQQALLEPCPSPSPSPSHVKEESIARFASSEIERIYQAYPRKVGKAAAMKAIKRVLQNLDDPTPVESLLRVVEEYARSPAGNNDVFTPHPATWFNRKSYLDDPKEWDKVK